MPTLIPEFARAMTESNRQAATALEEEIRRAQGLRERVEADRERQVGSDTLRRRLAREARAATRDIVAEAQETEELWSSAVQSLRDGLAVEEQSPMLQSVAELAHSGRDFRAAVRRLWSLVESLGGEIEGAEGLANADRLFDRTYSEASRALLHRQTPWQPADAARLEQGRQEIRAGMVIGPDEVRARFRKHPG